MARYKQLQHKATVEDMVAVDYLIGLMDVWSLTSHPVCIVALVSVIEVSARLRICRLMARTR